MTTNTECSKSMAQSTFETFKNVATYFVSISCECFCIVCKKMLV